MTAEINDTHYEAVLDDEPDWSRPPVYVDVVSRTEIERKPILPASLHRGNFGKTVKRTVGLNWYRARYHASRSWLYALLTLLWSVAGVGVLAKKQIEWFWLREGEFHRQEAATTGEAKDWLKLHNETTSTRAFRAWPLGLEVVGLIVVGCFVYSTHNVIVWAIACLVVMPTIAHYGHPKSLPIVQAAVVPPRFRTITADVVLRAYYAAKLGKPGERETEVLFGSRMERDGLGGRVLVDLPHGRTFKDVMNAKAAIASGLDVSVNQVFLRKDKSSERRHELYVTDIDPLAIPAGKTVMLNGKQTDIWKPVPLGLDQHGKKVMVPLLWNSILVGAQPRKGKTFATRLFALWAALDPFTQIVIADGKNSPDWKAFRMVAHRYVSGTHPNPLCADPIEDLLAALREVKAHIQEVNAVLAELPTSVCPEGKLTRDLSRTHPKLRMWLLVMEEFQLYYEHEEKDAAKEIADLLSFILAVGPSAGVSVLSSSQKPAGIGGAGNVGTMFTRYRDNHAGRFALKCGNRQVSEAVLGTEAYGEGFDASALPIGDEYRGVGILYGLTDEVPIVRTYLADAIDAEKILIAARAMREERGTLTGFAAGEHVASEFRDFLRDVDSVFYAGEAWISWPQLAKRLAELSPSHYAEISPATVSAQIRSLKVEAKKGRDTYQDDNPSVWGVPRANVAKELHRREIGAGR